MAVTGSPSILSEAAALIPTLPPGVNLIDTHCHLDMDDYRDDLQSVIQRATAHGVTGIITIGIDLDSSRQALAIARRFKAVRATVGIHPHHADDVNQDTLDNLAELVQNHRDLIVGFGEIGLDYVKQHAGREQQRQALIKQLGLARELKLPIVVHDREAHEDCLKILKAEGPLDQGGVMHCFSGNLEFARTIVDANLHVSIPGIVTFKNARDLQEVAGHLPLDRLLVETDGPFLAPVPHRGKRNEPLFTIYTACAIAALRGVDVSEVARHTSENAGRLFDCDFSLKREAAS
ncbi:MAG: TatD family hydrolase [Desulfofustis sp.]|nr:TatD family hydrolase [Desulfofustis sp.]